jgi:hypothetical protein
MFRHVTGAIIRGILAVANVAPSKWSGLLPRRPAFNPSQLCVGFMLEWHWGMFPPSILVFSCKFSTNKVARWFICNGRYVTLVTVSVVTQHTNDYVCFVVAHMDRIKDGFEFRNMLLRAVTCIHGWRSRYCTRMSYAMCTAGYTLSHHAVCL